MTSLGIINSISIVSRFREAFYTLIAIMLIIVFQSHKHCVKFIDMHLIIRIYVIQFLEHSSGADHLLTGASCCFQVQEDNIRQVTVKYSITVQPRTLRWSTVQHCVLSEAKLGITSLKFAQKFLRYSVNLRMDMANCDSN